MDAGVDRNHEDLEGKVLGDVGYVNPHGTHVAGIAAAKTNNDIGIVGLDWHALIWSEILVTFTITEISNAVMSATNAGCKIQSNSWSLDDYSPTLRAVFRYAFQMGVLPVTSMSNYPYPREYPQRYGPWMMNIGATNMNDRKADISVEGHWIDVAAPGEGIYSTIPGDNYGTMTGTSQATPVVSGLAGLLLGANSDLRNYDLEWLIKLSATDIESPGFDEKTGYGRVNADTAVMHVILPYRISRGNVSLTLHQSNASRDFLDRPLPDLPAGQYYCDIYKAECNLSFSPSYAVNPLGWINVTGFSGANPNNARLWMKQYLTTTSANLMTFFYYVKQNAAGQTINRWAPEDTSVLSEGLRYTVIGRRPIESPTNLQANEVPNSNNINIVWEDNSNNEAKFKIYRSTNGSSFPLYDSVTQNITQFTDNNTTQGQKYWYRIQAWAQEFHSGYSNIDDAVAGLAAPSNLTLIEQSGMNTVKIQWYDNSIIEAGFQIAKKVDDGTWSYITVGANVTVYEDDVEFLHKYNYKVRAYDDQEHYSEWSNEVEFMPGMLAGSECPTMSAFNNSAKVVMSGSNIYIVYVADQYWAPSGRPHIVYCLRSTDGGNSFIEDKLGSHGYIADYPSIALDDDAKPHVVWGAITKIGASYYRKYFYSTFNGNNWIAPQPIYGNSLDITGGLSEEHLCPPSFIIKGDSGFVAWQENYDHGGNYNGLNLTTFELSNPASTHATHGIKHGVCFMGLRAPCIGYDPGGRLVLVYATCWDPACAFGDINFIYREPNGIWSNPILIVSDPAIAGIPSLCTRYARVYIGFQHLLNNDSIACATLSWLGGNYTSPAISFIAQLEPQGQWPFSAFPNLVNENLVTWQNNDGDIYYSQRAGATWTTPENISNRPDEVSSYPHGVIFGGGSRRKLLALWTQQIGDDYYLVRDKIDLPSVCPYLDVAQSNIPEATGYNNSRRLIRDSQETLHLCFTNDNEIYHTLLQDTTWSEPVLVGTGKYPSLSLGVDNKLHSIYAYNEGSPDILEELRVSTFNDQNWSPQVPLMHTYDSYFWGVGAPSFAVDDTTGYFIFETSYGLTYHPAPGNTMPMIISFRGYALIYGEFPLASPADGQWQVLDSVPLHPIPVPIDTTMYEDSVVAKLISPSITLDPEAVVHILWEGFGDSLYYYQIEDTVITKQTSHGVMIDYPLITMREDQIDHFWCEQEVIKHRYAWTGTEALSETKTIAECESPFSSGPYLTWTKQDGMLSHLYYGEIPGSGMIESVEIEYSTDLIAYPQILYNPQMNNEPAAIDLVWTEYSYLDSVGYIYHLNLPIKEPAPTYAFDMGTETPVPVIVQRDGYLVLGPEAFQTFDYDSTELIYHMILHSPHKKYRIRWTYYHEESDKLKLQFSVDDILHHNRWVNPGEKVTEDTWIPQACLDDNEITIKVKRLSGTIAVLSGLEIEMHEVGGGGPQSAGVQPIKRFFFESMYPNPTKGMLKIRFNSPDERKVTVKMYDVVGRLAETIFNGKAKIGMNEFLIVPKDLAAGVYFIRLETSGYEKTEKIILLQ